LPMQAKRFKGWKPTEPDSQIKVAHVAVEKWREEWSSSQEQTMESEGLQGWARTRRASNTVAGPSCPRVVIERQQNAELEWSRMGESGSRPQNYAEKNWVKHYRPLGTTSRGSQDQKWVAQ
jgi:hypothetical protein